LIVVEATGGYATAVVAALTAAGLPVVVVNARQVRDFARAVAAAYLGWPGPDPHGIVHGHRECGAVQSSATELLCPFVRGREAEEGRAHGLHAEAAHNP